MLILTRRIGESVYFIHEDGTLEKLTILTVRGNQVRLGIEAPNSTRIHREEVFHKILDQNSGTVPGTQFNEETYYNQEESICDNPVQS
jgi:carbon storage regulator